MKYIFLLIIFSLIIVDCGNPESVVLPLFHKKPVITNSLVHEKGLSEYTIIEIDQSILLLLLSTRDQSPSIMIPFKDTILVLNLNAVDIFDSSFKVETESGEQAYDKGLHYQGTIHGQRGSVVSLSIFNDDVNGIISSVELGELNIGKSGTNIRSEYIVYDPSDMKDSVKFSCASPDSGYTTPDLERQKMIHRMEEKKAEAINNCVTIDFELTRECYTQFGTVQATLNWLTSLFSGVKALYKAEGIEMNIKYVYVWTVEDGYSDNPATALNQIQEKRKSDPAFTGNFVHLVRVQSNNLSGIAYVGTLCIPNYRFGFSAVLANYSMYPAYSWSTEVVTHELGHNMGSPHTQWCGWVGGALDNCYTTEGGCAPGPAPTNGGTIMSYCHMTGYGIKFSNGFGAQPKAKILGYYNSAACVNCTTTPPVVIQTCSDGIKNQNETGIDCGGVCVPCPVPPVVVPVVSIGKPARQSNPYNPYNSYPASKANDGATCLVQGANFSHTAFENQPWLEIDLQFIFKVSEIVITNRCDCCGNRLKRFKIFVSNQPVVSYASSGHVYSVDKSLGHGNGEIIRIPLTGVSGRYVRIWCDNTGYGVNPLHISEMSVHGILSTTGQCRDTTVKVMRPIDSTYQVCPM